ncbi:facilitated trehalose transporter Tret1-like isoform X2 [Topomyia yanbarensis]|uniref:facilitated trehalose transporter Tret1-like isoform X2 n=1 Tax=Topomyia yanbarensis TaxID=2498891 RepID=UPI00273B5CDC|nr:facilitated trehalose transporter Tret1-like isoform X2 [Topomyia yanbarensis]
MEKGSTSRQFFVGVTVNLASVALGTCLCWTSPMGPVYTSNDTSINPLNVPPTTMEESWIGSLIALGALAALFILSWILLLTTKTVGQLLAARLIQGFGIGFVMTVQTMYIGEIASKEYRGALGSLMQLGIVFGGLYVYAIGPYVNYHALQWACLAIPITFTVIFLFMPETPTFFIIKGRQSDAIKSLQFLRGMSADGVQDEMTEMTKSVEESMKNKANLINLLKSKGNVKSLIICVGLITFQQLSGINVILFYSQTIFAKTGSSLTPAISTILVGSVSFLASGATPIIVDRLGRKPILLASAAGMCLAHGTMGLYFYTDYLKLDVVDSIGWLPIFSLIFFVTVYCVGFGSIPWVVLGEMFPANMKSIAASIVASSCWVLAFLVLQFFSTLEVAVGSHWLFWIFGIMCGVAFVFTLTTVMETKGMSLQQIQDRLNK